MREKLIVASSILVLAGLARADKYAGEFMYIGAGARALAMGGTFTALADDATAGYWNPAGLVHLNGRQAQLMHSERFGGLISYDYLSYAGPMGGSSVGASLFRTDAGDVANTTQLDFYDTGSDGVFGEDGTGEPGDAGNDDYDPETNPEGTEGNGQWDPGEELIYDEGRITYQSCVDWALYLSWSRNFLENFSAGSSVKLIRRGIMDHSAWGMGLDLGAQWRPSEVLSTGITLQDVFGTYLFYDNGHSETVTPTVKLGLATTWPIRRFGSSVTFTMDGDFRFEGRRATSQYHVGGMSLDTHLGLEILIKDTVGLRLGSSEGSMTAGLGLTIGLMGHPVSVDYAFLGHQELDNTHRVSLGVGF